jgi:hypothetical protein
MIYLPLFYFFYKTWDVYIGTIYLGPSGTIHTGNGYATSGRGTWVYCLKTSFPLIVWERFGHNNATNSGDSYLHDYLWNNLRTWILGYISYFVWYFKSNWSLTRNYTPVWKSGRFGNAPGGRAGSVQFCPEHISYMFGGILMKLHRNVHHYEEQCRAHEPGL